jgi:predicted Rossmann-fold nucleotide-binding protein
MKDPRIVTVFGSSRPRAGDVHYAEAQALGTALAKNGFTVCTGGYGGTMEAASLGAKETEVTGMLPARAAPGRSSNSR